MSSKRHEWPLQLSRRVEITGRLRMESALHIGGGVGSTSITDAGVVRHADGRPYIPGSSLKGALRNHLARLCQTEAFAEAGATSCLLYPAGADDGEEPASPPTAEGCPTLAHTAATLHGAENGAPAPTDLSDWDKGRVDAFLDDLCCTCTLFGSPYLAGKIRLPDLEVDERTYTGEVEIRDGVGIDRDSGRAVDQVKFDYEVVPSDTVFEFSVMADSPSEVELGLLAAGIRELQRGKITVGGKTTRGLGQCRLEDVSVRDETFESAGDLASYLKTQVGESNPAAVDPESFLNGCIDDLLG